LGEELASTCLDFHPPLLRCPWNEMHANLPWMNKSLRSYHFFCLCRGENIMKCYLTLSASLLIDSIHSRSPGMFFWSL
jgi:hypothetical protein